MSLAAASPVTPASGPGGAPLSAPDDMEAASVVTQSSTHWMWAASRGLPVGMRAPKGGVARSFV